MTQVLVWIEPHPIRDQFEEFFSHALFLAEALLLLRDRGVQFRLLSNQQVLERLAREYPATADALLWPTETESTFIQSQAGDWNADRLANWLDLVRGRGTVADTYRAIADRAIAETKPDLVVLWSDNDAVRAAALEAGVALMHFELGPTRAPFRSTFYMDPIGTNGLASFRNAPLPVTPDADFDAMVLADPPIPQSRPLREQVHAARDALQTWLPTRPYAFLPLQLADDLNAQLHSAYASPRAFLEAAIGPLQESGLEVVVKGHPNVAARASNAAAEAEALSYAETLGDRVHIAPRHLDSPTQMALIGGSALICTVNSSIGFEALLLERPVTLLGDAAYDLSGTLKRDASSGMMPASPALAQRIPAPMLRHFLHPKEEGTAHEVIARALEFTARHPNRPLSDADVLADWTTTIDHATDTPVETAEAPMGYISDIEERTDANRVFVRIQGWAFDAATDHPLPGFGVRAEGVPLAITRRKPLRPDVTRAVGCRSCSVGIDLSFTTSVAAWRQAVLTIETRDGPAQSFALRRGRLSSVTGTPPVPVPTIRNGAQDLRPRNVLSRIRNSAAMRLRTFRPR